MSARTHNPPAGRRGFALVLVLLTVVFASLLGTSYLASISLRTAGARNHLGAHRARYLAECGVEHALYFLQTDPQTLLTAHSLSPLGPYSPDEGSDSYSFHAQFVVGETDVYQVFSVGRSGQLSQSCTARVHCPTVFAARMTQMAPLSWWRLGEDSGALAGDVRGLHPGVCLNGPVRGAEGALIGSRNAATEFDGSNDAIDTGKWDLDGSAMSIVAWFRVDDTSGRDDGRILSKATGTSNSEHWWMLSTDRKGGHLRLRMRLKTGSNTTTLHAGSGNIVQGQWHFAAATYDGAHMVLYLDGEEVGRRSKSGEIARDEDVSVWVGGNPPDVNARCWPGALDEVAVFQRCLSPEEIRILHEARIPTPRIVAWEE